MFGLLSSSCCEDSSRRFGHCTLWPSSGGVREIVVDSIAIAMKESPLDGRKTLLKKKQIKAIGTMLRRKLSSQQDKDKSPNNYSNHTIPSSTKLRKKPTLFDYKKS